MATMTETLHAAHPDALPLCLARDLAERSAIQDEARRGNFAGVTSGRLLELNSRINKLYAAGVTPLFR